MNQSSSQHVAVCPSSGMGHLAPFLRLAATLSSSSYNLQVTLVAIRPTVSVAETNELTTFFATHPHIACLDFHLQLPLPTSEDDPFFLRFDAIRRNARLLGEKLTGIMSPIISAVFMDLVVANGVIEALAGRGIVNVVVATTSASFFSAIATLPQVISNMSINKPADGEVEVPGLDPIPTHSIPPPFFDTQHIFTQLLLSFASAVIAADAIILNTFEFFEPEAISALRDGRVLNTLPPIFPIGPISPLEDKMGKGEYLAWLDEQPDGSVVYVCFGSRTAMSKDQIRELGYGLLSSGQRFLWVVKTSKVDREDESELEEVLGEGFFDSVKGRGIVIKEWVNQVMILGHRAVGGFLNHCGWNSVMEAARYGKPMVAWPQHGDQRVNAGVAEKAGLAVWEREWGWIGVRLVTREDIAGKVIEMMTDEEFRKRASKIGEEARNAWTDDGSSRAALLQILDMLRKD